MGQERKIDDIVTKPGRVGGVDRQAGGEIEWCVFGADDTGPQIVQLVFQPVITPIQVVNPANERISLRGQRPQHQRGGGAQVRGHDGSGGELGNATDDGGAIVHFDVGAHPLELGAVHEALRENGVLDHADARCGG